ncbi:MAG: gluconeogenesis factor YvcK family protein [Cyanobacteria bacterium J06642_2]
MSKSPSPFDPRPTVRRWQKWLSPGLDVKRWLSLAIAGTVFTVFGLAILVGLTPVFRFQQLVGVTLRAITSIIPSHISGPLVLLVGLGMLIFGVRRTFGSLSDALVPEGDEDELVDKLLQRKRLGRGPKIVVVGGGTGLSTLLRGLKQFSSNITAVVTVADDGGSSGRLRREIGVLPPGDIRNCLTALASEEKLLTELFQFRFETGEGLSGHSFGNLFITALSEVTGKDLIRAIAMTSRVLAIRGQVLPSTLADVTLWAEMSDGRWIEGESSIAKARGHIVRVGCKPAQPLAVPEAIAAIQAADFIVLGPGSLYTSIIPNLLVPEMVEAIANSIVPRIYVCNIMTEPGETTGYTASDHVLAIDKVAGKRLFDGVLVQKYQPSELALSRYREEGAEPVLLDPETLAQLNCRAVLANVMKEDETKGTIRHDSDRLAAMLMRWYERHRA